MGNLRIDARFEVFTAVKIQVEVFCVTTPRGDVVRYVSEDLVAYIFRVKVLLISYLISTPRRNAEDLDVDLPIVQKHVFRMQCSSRWFLLHFSDDLFHSSF
jgi:hypothetical protein